MWPFTVSSVLGSQSTEHHPRGPGLVIKEVRGREEKGSCSKGSIFWVCHPRQWSLANLSWIQRLYYKKNPLFILPTHCELSAKMSFPRLIWYSFCSWVSSGQTLLLCKMLHYRRLRTQGSSSRELKYWKLREWHIPNFNLGQKTEF